MELRAELKRLAAQAAGGPGGHVPTYNDMVVKACALALREHPRANGELPRRAPAAALARQRRRRGRRARRAGRADRVRRRRKSLGEIARETRALAERVRDGTITPPELGGGTFTVSNLGMYGVEQLHRDHQPAAGRDPLGGRARAARRGARGRALGAPHDDAHARLRPPHPLRRRRRALPRAHPRAAAAPAALTL